ncbi:MAG TPA: hypothetical protein VFG84_00045 [Gemmatimonadaceae bacterium]|nr:hypothetical protein [Gemmatimonadaceae bacterium]
MTFPGMAKGDWNREIIMVSAYGTLNRTCQVGPWGSSGADLVANVYCFLPDGQPGDSPFTMLLAESGTINGRFGFALVEPDPASSADRPDPRFTANSSGGGVTWTSTGTGVYRVRFADIGRLPGDHFEAAFVSAYGNTPRRCSVWSWGTDTADSLVVDVRCFDMSGQPAESPFVIMALDEGRTGLRVGFAWTPDADALTYIIQDAFEHSTSIGDVVVTHTSTGLYDVVFEGLARTPGAPELRESVMVTSYKVSGYCNVREWSLANGHTTARVGCFAADGTPADMRFNVLVVE